LESPGKIVPVAGVGLGVDVGIFVDAAVGFAESDEVVSVVRLELEVIVDGIGKVVATRADEAVAREVMWNIELWPCRSCALELCF
jgi:hypothetical protein